MNSFKILVVKIKKKMHLIANIILKLTSLGMGPGAMSHKRFHTYVQFNKLLKNKKLFGEIYTLCIF